MPHTTRRHGVISHLLHFLFSLILILASVKSFALTYCSAKGTYATYEYIKGVTINGLTSNSTGQGYFLFTSPTFQLNPGNNSATLTPGFNGSSYQEGWSVLVDLNQDGTFSSDERLIASTSSSAITTSLSIPATAKSGATRMRVIMQYSTYLATGCGTFYYGEVEDYTVNINAGTPPPPPPPPPAPVKISTTTVAGYDHSSIKDLVLEARYFKGGITYISSIMYYANSATLTTPITLDVDANTVIEWTAHGYLDYSATGILIPASCRFIMGNKCITTAGAFGETVIFKEQPPASGSNPAADITLDFNNQFGGASYQVGPTINLANGIKATTTGGSFSNPTGSPFNWGYLSFTDLTLDFATPVAFLSFKATNNCYNCSYTVNMLADGLLVGSFLANNTITNVNMSMPIAASKISFSQGFKMDDLAVTYAIPPPPTKVSTTTIVDFDIPYTANLVIEGKYKKNGITTISSTVYKAYNPSTSAAVKLDVDINTPIEWSAHVFLDNTAAGVFVPLNCTAISGNSCITNAGAQGEIVRFKKPDNTPPITPIQNLTFNFENLFGGTINKVGPTLDLGNGITASTTGTYFRNPTGGQFNSGYFAFSDLTLNFPSPVLNLSFKASGNCTNCTQTVVVTADGQVVKTIPLNYSPAVPITLSLPAVSKINFSQGFNMDDLTIVFK